MEKLSGERKNNPVNGKPLASERKPNTAVQMMTKQENKYTKGRSLCKQCLHNLQFMKKISSSPNLAKLARADISCQFMKTRSLILRILYEFYTDFLGVYQPYAMRLLYTQFFPGIKNCVSCGLSVFLT